MSENPTIKLNPTGQPMPLVGVGMWQVPKEKATDLVVEALKLGYRLVVFIIKNISFKKFFLNEFDLYFAIFVICV
jgi:hypothetical protein